MSGASRGAGTKTGEVCNVVVIAHFVLAALLSLLTGLEGFLLRAVAFLLTLHTVLGNDLLSVLFLLRFHGLIHGLGAFDRWVDGALWVEGTTWAIIVTEHQPEVVVCVFLCSILALDGCLSVCMHARTCGTCVCACTP